MKKFRWKENEIEDMLRQLPQIKDKRSKEEVVVGIDNKKRKRRIKQWIPLIAGIASLFIMMIIGSSLITEKEEYSSQTEEIIGNGKLATNESEILRDQQHQYDDKTKQKGHDLNKEESNLREETEFKSHTQKEGRRNISTGAIYSEELEDKSIITLGVPDDQRNFIIPISFIVDHFDETDALNQVVKKMSEINEKYYGLSDYFPLDIKVTKDTINNTAHFEFPTDSKLLDEDILFLRTMEETLAYLKIDKMTFATGSRPGALFAHAGLLEEEEIPQHKNRTYLLYQKDESSPKFLVPSHLDYQKLEEAIHAAKEDPGIEGVSPAIPESLKWKNISIDGDLVTVELASVAELGDNIESLRALEVILFTVKDFGYKRVKFKDAPITTVGYLDLKKELTVPVAPNQVN